VPYGRRKGVADPLGPVCLPWGRGRSLGPRMAAVGAWPVSWASYGRSWGMAVVGVWLVPWTNYGQREGVAGTLVPV